MTIDAQHVERVIRAYFRACNDADAAGITACLTPDAVQFNYPPGEPMRGGATIAALFAAIVQEEGRRWTGDRIVVDAEKAEAAIEYSRFKTGDATVARGPSGSSWTRTAA